MLASSRRFDLAGALSGTAALGAAGRRDLTSPSVRLGFGPDDRDTRGSGRACCLRSLRSSARASEPILPLAIFRLPTLAAGECGRVAARRELLRVRLRGDAVHAGGAALQRPGDRSRVAVGIADVDGAGRCVAVARNPRRYPLGDGRRDGDDWGRHPMGHAGPGKRTFPRQPRRPDGRRRRGHRLLVHPDLCSRAVRDQGAPGRPCFRPAEHLPTVGGRAGIALASSVANSHKSALLHTGAPLPEALTAGFQRSFWVLGILALLALPVIFTWVRDNRSLAPDERPVAVDLGEVPAPAFAEHG